MDEEKDNKKMNMDHYRGYAKKLFLGHRFTFLRLFGQKYTYSHIFVNDFTLPLSYLYMYIYNENQ